MSKKVKKIISMSLLGCALAITSVSAASTGWHSSMPGFQGNNYVGAYVTSTSNSSNKVKVTSLTGTTQMTGWITDYKFNSLSGDYYFGWGDEKSISHKTGHDTLYLGTENSTFTYQSASADGTIDY